VEDKCFIHFYLLLTPASATISQSTFLVLIKSISFFWVLRRSKRHL